MHPPLEWTPEVPVGKAAVRGFFVDKSCRVLLLSHPYQDYEFLQLPGGRPDPSDGWPADSRHIYNTLGRELSEELLLPPKVKRGLLNDSRLLDVYSINWSTPDVDEQRQDLILAFWYTGDDFVYHPTNELITVCGDACSGYGWFDLRAGVTGWWDYAVPNTQDALLKAWQGILGVFTPLSKAPLHGL